MNYSIKLMEKIQLFDRVLAEIGGEPLAENGNFRIDAKWSTDWHVEYDIVPKDRPFLPIRVIIDEDYVRLDIANYSEVVVWTNEDITDSLDDFISFIGKLFSSQMLIESADGYAKLTFLDHNSRLVDEIEMGNQVNKIIGKLLMQPSKKEAYLPLYG